MGSKLGAPIFSNSHRTPLDAALNQIKVKTIILVALLSLSPAAHCDNLGALKTLAENGNAQAQFALAFMYDKGEDVAQDYSEAARWYRGASRQGIAFAQYRLGQLYELGQGLPTDRKQAVDWYRKAAEQGFAKAQYKLGDSYALGLGVRQDHQVSAKWFREAAERGYADAQYRLGMSYAHGREGVPQDHVQAHMWLSLAADQRLAEGRQALALIEQEMTSTQIVASRRLQHAWMSNKNKK